MEQRMTSNKSVQSIMHMGAYEQEERIENKERDVMSYGMFPIMQGWRCAKFSKFGTMVLPVWESNPILNRRSLVGDWRVPAIPVGDVWARCLLNMNKD